MSESLCSVPGCEREHKARGYCALHYDRLLRNGHTDSVNDVLRRPLVSDNLRDSGLSFSQKTSIVSLVRSLPPRKP